MARDGDDLPAEDLWSALGPRLDDERAASSAHARSRRRWLQQLAAESTTLAGVLLTLAEREALVILHCGSWTHRGRLRRVTAPLAVLETGDGLALVPTGSITLVEAVAAVADDRVPGPGPDLATLLAALVPERPPVRLQLVDGAEVVGRLTEVGKDVALVRLASSVATIPLTSVVSCILGGPGNGDRARPAQDGESGDDLASLEDLGSG